MVKVVVITKFNLELLDCTTQCHNIIYYQFLFELLTKPLLGVIAVYTYLNAYLKFDLNSRLELAGAH